MRLYYLHGFNSSPQSDKARVVSHYVTKHCPGTELVLPTLHFAPASAMALLDADIAAHPGPKALIGSSLGGFYATSLAERHGLKAVLVNPAVRPFELLSDYLGPQVNPYTGETFEVSHRHMAELLALFVPVLSHPERLWLLQKEGDEVLDWRQARDHYQGARQTIEAGGDHAFTDLDKHLGQMAAFLDLC
ncbi:MAG: YqiA/YcfP family alpha/beta fold hydrolase [Pseudomonadota bacterium]|uniref:YqiA/YcfP family alpha/beta fold hydrolase n=1 Tax=Gallaecimonas pentaromativorans TaxID=584787 RepID=UPI00067F4C70|nr:YqiA/YcfP family alpha/beta fold hydrolase [Gallaecimonas pentaromativorans]MED5524738.1 YqiA/YcfP family alpha/beta fold hydrolase [Pseudomonadota bacterium]